MRPLCISEPKNDLGKTVWLKFEVTNEVTDEKSRKKSSVFKGFRRQGVKSTVSKQLVVRLSSASADLSAFYVSKPGNHTVSGFFAFIVKGGQDMPVRDTS